jgi:hypothetical protein
MANLSRRARSRLPLWPHRAKSSAILAAFGDASRNAFRLARRRSICRLGASPRRNPCCHRRSRRRADSCAPLRPLGISRRFARILARRCRNVRNRTSLFSCNGLSLLVLSAFVCATACFWRVWWVDSPKQHAPDLSEGQDAHCRVPEPAPACLVFTCQTTLQARGTRAIESRE